ncbi:hypothetical protein J2Y69_003553 [Microbacterium resistens]|uniref:Uncharacterized protein n=1 Tax=Microbacterium resistens TaxID=156977 RepID=A0ABU1SJ54_9MICO|nr:hypothetical protein [Microbacterium resistens]MDR6868927.1 hypothetical protein [Microbacterium resistens]
MSINMENAAATAQSTAVDRHPNGLGFDTRLVSELRRGSTFGRTLTQPMRDLLDSLVVPELVREESIIDAGHTLDPFRRVRNRNRINRLIAMRFVRRDGGFLRPTIAGIGAIRPLVVASAQPQTVPSVHPVAIRRRREQVLRPRTVEPLLHAA